MKANTVQKDEEMSVEIKVPVFPESVVDGTIVTWHKNPGDQVSRDEVIVDIETDKVMFEVPAPASGILQNIRCQEGDVVESGQALGSIVEMSATAANDGGAVSAGPVTETGPAAAGDVPVAPAARKLILEHALNSRKIPGTGKDGRILKEDVLRFLNEDDNASSPAETKVPSRATPETPTQGPGGQVDGPAPSSQPAISGIPQADPQTAFVVDEDREKRVPMTRLRARIAERLVEAQQTAAILTTFNEVNMKPVMDLRARYKDIFEKKHGAKLGFMSFFVKAAAEALKRFPVINASIDGNDIVYHGFFDIGIAVSSPRGLVVPVLRDVDQMGMAEIETSILDYAGKAKNGSLSIEDMTGGTFTITNGGVFGSLVSTPILNPPQSAILGMHKIQERPVVENGEIVARPMMYLALSYDHRIVDGQGAVQFLVAIKDMLEDPARLLLEI